jgi:hypothetical protein
MLSMKSPCMASTRRNSTKKGDVASLNLRFMRLLKKHYLHMKRLLGLLMPVLLLTTCVERIGVDLPDASEKLVVDGLISTMPGPYTVKLTQTAQYTTGSDGTNYLVGGARVRISDDAGNSEELIESSQGIYKTRTGGLQGQAGRSYTLFIETPAGKKYQSRPELLKPTPAIENIYYEFVEATPGKEEGFYVYIDVRDPAATEDYYRWNWVHYERIQYCFNEVVPPATTPTVLNCCTNCWDIRRCNGCVNVASDRLVNGAMLSRQLLAIVPYTARSRYFLYYEQHSLTRDAFKFWKALEEQSKNVGGIFDKPPATVRGNMYNPDDAEEVVLGYFGASDIKPGAIQVDRSGIIKNPSGPPPIVPPISNGPPPPCYPCQESTIRTQNTPPLWRD